MDVKVKNSRIYHQADFTWEMGAGWRKNGRLGCWHAIYGLKAQYRATATTTTKTIRHHFCSLPKPYLAKHFCSLCWHIGPGSDERAGRKLPCLFLD